MVQFEFVLKGRGFIRAVNSIVRARTPTTVSLQHLGTCGAVGPIGPPESCISAFSKKLDNLKHSVALHFMPREFAVPYLQNECRFDPPLTAQRCRLCFVSKAKKLWQDVREKSGVFAV